MDFVNLFITLIIYFLTSFCFLTCIFGYGRLINEFINLDTFWLKIEILNFFIGLIFLGFLGILISFFSPISDLISFLIITIGIIFYLIKFLNINNKNKELINTLIILIISIAFSFYAGLNDDYGYHYETIKNYKFFPVNEIDHHRWISYNSHWLLINSIFYLTFNTTSLFVLTGLIYSIAILDLWKIYKHNEDGIQNYFLKISSLFFLIFLIGVLNHYKDYGTDFPGVIIGIFIFLIFINIILNKKKIDTKIFLLLLILANFAFMIKLTHSLIYFFILIIFLLRKNFLKDITFILLISIPVFFWIIQNYFISGCLIWPITVLCFENLEHARNEMYLIESFAKGDINTSISINGISWLGVWLKNHLVKVIEIYLFYFLLLFLPIMFMLYNKKIKFNKSFIIFFKSNNYYMIKILLLPIIISNLIWFFYTPAYRFGVFYNLNLIIILITPFWIQIYKDQKSFFIKYVSFLFFLSLLFFTYENISKYKKNIIKYNYEWPPIKNYKLTVL